MDPPRANLPPVIRENVIVQPKEPDAVREPKGPSKRIIVIHAKNIKPLDKELFSFWGKVLVWSEHYINIPFVNLPDHDYLFMDVHNKNARLALDAEDLSNQAVVCYISSWQQDEQFIKQLSAHSCMSFPQRSVNKDDFERQLLNPKIIAPSAWKAFLRLVIPKCMELL